MIRISKMTDYATVILAELARAPQTQQLRVIRRGQLSSLVCRPKQGVVLLLSGGFQLTSRDQLTQS